MTPTWFEHAAFWSGVRRATVAPRSHNDNWGKKIGSTEIWTRIAGFKVQSANHYTIEPGPTRMGFEPTRAEPNGLAVHRLNHSATSSCHGRTVEFLPWMREVPCSKPGWVGKISPGHIMLRRSTRLVSHHFVTSLPSFYFIQFDLFTCWKFCT